MAIVHNLTFNIAAKIGGFTKPLRQLTNNLNRMKRDMSLWGKTITAPFRMASAVIGKTFSLLMKPVHMFMNLLNRLKYIAIGTFSTIAYYAQSKGRSFEDAMAQMQGVLQGSSEQFEKLRSRALEMSKWNVGPTQAAEALRRLALAGNDANQMYEQLPAVALLSQAAMMDTATSASTVTSVMKQMGYTASEMPEVIDILAKSASSANFELQDMAEAFKYIGPGARMAGVNLKELLVMQQMMANAGIRGSMAGTSTRNIISRLAGATPAVTRRIKKLGIEIKDTAGRMRPMSDIVGQLMNKTKNMDDLDVSSLMTTIFGQRGAPGMQAIIEQGPKRFVEAMNDLGNSSGFASRQAAANFNTLSGASLNLGVELQKVAANFIKLITPNLVGWVQWLTKLIKENHATIVMWGVNFYKWLVKLGIMFTWWVKKLLDPETRTDTISSAMKWGINLGKSLVSGVIQAIKDNSGAIAEVFRTILEELGLGWMIKAAKGAGVAGDWIAAGHRVLVDKAQRAMSGTVAVGRGAGIISGMPSDGLELNRRYKQDESNSYVNAPQAPLLVPGSGKAAANAYNLWRNPTVPGVNKIAPIENVIRQPQMLPPAGGGAHAQGGWVQGGKVTMDGVVHAVNEVAKEVKLLRASF